MEFNSEAIRQAIEAIDGLPRKILTQVSHLTPAQLARSYRPQGWTVRQLVNHIADANVNNYTRFKFALTENNPVIKPYLEEEWSALADAAEGDIRPALDLISAIHGKWVQTLHSLSEAQLRRTFHHPKMQRDVPLFEAIGMYAWHGDHHLAHIRLATAVQP